jgi:hypothetical protein
MGPRAVQRRSVGKLLAEAAYSREHNCIFIRRDVASELVEFRIYEEVAEFWVYNCAAPNWEKEPATRQLGAALRAPLEAYLVALGRHGRDFNALAKAFRADPVSMSLRYGETTGAPALLVSERSIAPRGQPCLEDMTDAEIRALAFGPKKARNVDRIPIAGDRPGVLILPKGRRAG